MGLRSGKGVWEGCHCRALTSKDLMESTLYLRLFQQLYRKWSVEGARMEPCKPDSRLLQLSRCKKMVFRSSGVTMEVVELLGVGMYFETEPIGHAHPACAEGKRGDSWTNQQK